MSTMTEWVLYRVEFGWNGHFNEIYTRDQITKWLSDKPSDYEIASYLRQYDYPEDGIYELRGRTIMA